MLREQKAKAVDKLADKLSRSTIVISTSYQGVATKDVAGLRRTLTREGIDYCVVKNTLTRLAADKVGKRDVMNIIEGPVALAFAYDDVIWPAKVLSKYIKAASLNMRIGGALVGDRLLGADEVIGLAALPSKEVLVSQLLQQLQVPMTGLHNVLSSPLRGLLNVLQATKYKKDV